MKIDRREAIELLCSRDLDPLTLEERAEQLEIMGLETWDSDPSWASLPESVQREFEHGTPITDPGAQLYDPVLLIWLRRRYVCATNDYLLQELLTLESCPWTEVMGQPVEATSCPCCGLRTLSCRAAYEICVVCWWEDDGQDNDTAAEVFGGPNASLSLSRARLNFLREGIYDPSRKDLRALQEPPEKYAVGRRFELLPGCEGVQESGEGWIEGP